MVVKLLKDEEDLVLKGLKAEWRKHPKGFRKQQRFEQRAMGGQRGSRGPRREDLPAEAMIGLALTVLGGTRKVLLNRGNRPCAKARRAQGAQGRGCCRRQGLLGELSSARTRARGLGVDSSVPQMRTLMALSGVAEVNATQSTSFRGPWEGGLCEQMLAALCGKDSDRGS